MDMTTALMNAQKRLKNAGYYTGKIDGDWGGGSTGALNAAVKDGRGAEMTPEFGLAWSKSVSPEFLIEVDKFNLSTKLMKGDQPHFIMGCMAFETGRTFSPSIQNLGKAPYYGLIQWGKDAAADVKMTTDKLRALTAEQQMVYVTQWFKPYAGRIQTLSDVYLRIFMPTYVGKPENSLIAVEGTATYRQNSGLDVNGDKRIQKWEAAYKVMEQLQLGMQPKNRRLL